RVTHGTWFGGQYIDKNNFFAKFGIDQNVYFDLFPEFIIKPEEMEAFRKERNGAIIGRKLADRFGWKVGDRIPIIGDIYPGNWDLVVSGIYTGTKKTTDETAMLFRYDFLDERMREESPTRSGKIGWFIIQIADPNQAAHISEQVDALFKNSLAGTKT